MRRRRRRDPPQSRRDAFEYLAQRHVEKLRSLLLRNAGRVAVESPTLLSDAGVKYEIPFNPHAGEDYRELRAQLMNASRSQLAVYARQGKAVVGREAVRIARRLHATGGRPIRRRRGESPSHRLQIARRARHDAETLESEHDWREAAAAWSVAGDAYEEVGRRSMAATMRRYAASALERARLQARVPTASDRRRRAS